MVNVRKQKNLEQALEFQIKADRLIARISHRFIQLPFSDLNSGINDSLREIGEFLQVDTSYIFQYAEDYHSASMTYEWIRMGLPSQLSNCQNLPCAAFPWATERICAGDQVICSSLDELLPEAKIDRQIWESLGVKSVLCIPLRDRQRIIGFVGFVSFTEQVIWSENMIHILQMFSQMLSHVIQRQQAEKELKLSELKYATLAEAVPVGIFRMDIDGNCIYVNERWCQIAGFEQELALGKGWTNALHPEDRDRIIERWHISINQQQTFQEEYRVQKSTGEIFWVFGQVIPEYNLQGEVCSYIGTITDISDRKRHELEQNILNNTLLKSEEHYRQIIEVQTDLILRSLPDTTITFANDAVCAALGKPLEKVIGLQWADFVPPENLADIYRKISNLTPENPSFENINQDYRPNNQIGWTQWINLGIFDDNRQLIEIQSVGRDVTRLQQQIKREKTLNQIFQCIRNFFDLETIFTTATREIGQFFPNSDCHIVQYLPDQEIWRVVARFDDNSATPGQEIADTDYPFASKLKEFQIVKIDNITNEINSSAKLIIPLIIENQLWGSFNLNLTEESCIWNQDEIELAQSVVNQLEVAIQQADLHQQIQLELAERIEVEKELRESEERLRLAIKAGNQGLYDLNLQTGEALVNDEYAIMLGYDPEEFQETNAKWIERLHADDLERVIANYQAYINGEIPEYRVEFRQRTKTGDWKWILSIGKILAWDEEGKSLRMLGTHTDITDLKLAQQALKDSETRLSNVIANLPGYVYRELNDPDYTPEFISEGVYEVNGYRQEDYLVHRTVNCGKVIHPDDQEKVWQIVQRALDKKEPFECEYRIISKSGAIKWVWEKGRGFWNERGELLYLEGFITDITNHKETELALQKSYQEYDELVKRIPIGVYKFRNLANQTTRFDYVSPHWCELNQITPKEIYQDVSLIYQRIHPDDRENLFKINEIVDCILEKFVWEGRLLIEGEVRWMHMESSPTMLENDDVVWDGIQYDITDRILAQQEQERLLKEAIAARTEASQARDLLASVFERMNDGIVALNNQMHYTYLNENGAALLGRTPQQLLGKHIWTEFPEGIGQPFYHAYQQAIQEQKPIYIEEYYEPWNRWFENRIYPSPDGLTIYFTDITQRKEAESHRIRAEQLKLELNLLEKLLNIVLAGYWDWNIVNHTTYMSPGLKRMFGYEDWELPNIPETWQNLIFPEDLPPTLECLEKHIQSHGEIPYYNEVRYHHKNGSTVWVICSGEIIEWDELGNPVRIIGCHVDITRRKQAEEELQQKTQQLEIINQELESFSYSVSHDLRAPLRHINGFVNALEQRLQQEYPLVSEDNKIEHYLEVIETSSHKMTQLIDGLLNLSRMGRREMEFKPVNLSNIVQEVISILNPQTSVQFVIRNLPTVIGDATLLKQVFSNLISNAVKFSRNHPTPIVEIGSLPDQTIFVKDNGAGFSMDYANKLFGAFQRLHSQKEFEGTGIGLAIVQRIITRHGGLIWAESNINQGATFYFKINN